ncbi:MAG: ABC transporter ATP-binding protein [Sporocytophaga sp.]|uniref:ABC transporter ATP-binding protein n=1 Tax=Sporocytophaga sp. TaxID=2231183 RepID=UPI001B2B8994|nr:ABC transporter ATP-binding protein [Sporocytophaga sp.]MBO9703321.1 ABC transporter ATP-binding protein [Sporocytophaga sp.]
MKETIIELRGVSKIFHSRERDYTALKRIDLNIKKGEYIAIVGKSGSGKSTLLNMITGIDHPSAGTILVNGTEISGLTESKLALWRGKNVGIVFQFFQLVPTLTIKENLLLAMEFVGEIPSSQRSKRVHELLEKVGILQHMDKMPSGLSGGEQQRAAIARALSNDPSIIIADEPTGNLDSKTAASIHKLFQSLVTEGKTLIVVTHEKEANLRYHRIVTLTDGEILNQKTEKELL